MVYISKALNIVLVGDAGVGKSTLIDRCHEKNPTFVEGGFFTKPFEPRSDYKPTSLRAYSTNIYSNPAGVVYSVYQTNLIDTGGAGLFDSVRPLAYMYADLFILCFDVISRGSFESIVSKWLPEVRCYEPKTPVMLVGLKDDLTDDKEISKSEGARFGEQIKACVSYIEASSFRDSKEASTVFETAVAQAFLYRQNSLIHRKLRGRKLEVSQEPGFDITNLETQSCPPLLKISHSTLTKDWKTALEEESNANVVIKFHNGSSSIKAHSFVLSLMSGVFRDLFSSLHCSNDDVAELEDEVDIAKAPQRRTVRNKAGKPISTLAEHSDFLFTSFTGIKVIETEKSCFGKQYEVTLEESTTLDVMNLILEWLYTGTLNATENSDLKSVGEVALGLRIEPLAWLCAEILNEKMKKATPIAPAPPPLPPPPPPPPHVWLNYLRSIQVGALRHRIPQPPSLPSGQVDVRIPMPPPLPPLLPSVRCIPHVDQTPPPPLLPCERMSGRIPIPPPLPPILPSVRCIPHEDQPNQPFAPEPPTLHPLRCERMSGSIPIPPPPLLPSVRCIPHEDQPNQPLAPEPPTLHPLPYERLSSRIPTPPPLQPLLPSVRFRIPHVDQPNPYSVPAPPLPPPLPSSRSPCRPTQMDGFCPVAAQRCVLPVVPQVSSLPYPPPHRTPEASPVPPLPPCSIAMRRRSASEPLPGPSRAANPDEESSSDVAIPHDDTQPTASNPFDAFLNNHQIREAFLQRSGFPPTPVALPKSKKTCCNSQQPDAKAVHLTMWRQGMRDYFLNKPALSDITLIVEDIPLPAHRAVLVTRSDVMAAMLAGKFREKEYTTIELPGMSLTHFLVLLEYMYTDECSLHEENVRGVIVLADRFCMDGLVERCESFILDGLSALGLVSDSTLVETVMDVIHFAKAYNAQYMFKWCLHVIATNYSLFEKTKDYNLILEENQEYIESNRWLPRDHLQALNKYKATAHRRLLITPHKNPKHCGCTIL